MLTLELKHFLEYNPDTLQYLRKTYNLDSQEERDEAVSVLEKWLAKQEHFIKKEYPKDFLEKSLINSKGSIEQVKAKLDKVATFKTLLPNYFETLDVLNSKTLKNVYGTYLPKMTKDHNRIVIVKVFGDEFPNDFDVYKYSIMLSEFNQACDYSNRVIVVYDTQDCNVVQLVKSINFVNFRQIISIVMEGYKIRIKGFHFLTASKATDIIINMFKQALSQKLRERIYVHSTVEQLHEYLPRELLPKDYGGDEKPIKELSDELKNLMASEEFTKYFNECKLAKTNEDFRSIEMFNEQCLSMPGSFRRINVD